MAHHELLTAATTRAHLDDLLRDGDNARTAAELAGPERRSKRRRRLLPWSRTKGDAPPSPRDAADTSPRLGRQRSADS